MAKMIDIDWRPDAAALRKFGVTVLVGFAVIGAVLQFAVGSPEAARIALVLGAALGVPALSGLSIALPGYWLWMGFAFVLGNIMSRVLLATIYFVVVTPIGLLRRLLGKDALSLSRHDAESFWRDVGSGSREHGYDRQF